MTKEIITISDEKKEDGVEDDPALVGNL